MTGPRAASTYRAHRRNAARETGDLRYWRLKQRIKSLGRAPWWWRAPGKAARELYARFGRAA